MGTRFIKVFLLIIFIVSCSKKEEKEFYETGKLKSIKSKVNDTTLVKFEYNVDGEKKSKEVFINNKIRFSFFYEKNKLKQYRKNYYYNIQEVKDYDKNGNLVSEGILINDSIKKGWWTFYDNGLKKKYIEYIPLCDGEYYLNQLISFDQDKSNKKDIMEVFTNIEIKRNGNKYRMFFSYKGLFEKSKLYFVLSNKNNFCEISKIKKFEVMYELGNKHEGYIELDNLKNTKGFFYERYETKIKGLPKNQIEVSERNTYIDLNNYLEK